MGHRLRSSFPPAQLLAEFELRCVRYLGAELEDARTLSEGLEA